jgi:hypothetical protein
MSRSPVVLVTGALIGIGRAIAIRYGRAWAGAGSWRLLGDVGGGDSRVRANGQPDQHASEQQHRGVRMIAACMATAPSTPRHYRSAVRGRLGGPRPDPEVARAGDSPAARDRRRDQAFGDLADYERFVTAYRSALASLHERGARTTLKSLV